MSEMTTGPVKDFTRKRERVTFRVDSDLFEAASALPGQTLTEFARRFSDIGSTPATEQLTVLTDALAMVLLPESAARFSKRFADLENPIELEQASEIVMWLLERYGLRPTQPSSPSASGPVNPEPGTSSTDAQPPTQHPSQTSPRAGS